MDNTILDKQDQDICHADIDNTPWRCMTVTSSSTQLIYIPVNQPEQARLGNLSCGHKQHALDKHDRDIPIKQNKQKLRLCVQIKM